MADTKDPFSNHESTVFKPTPGGRRPEPVNPAPAADPVATARPSFPETLPDAVYSGANPILAAATPLFAIVGQLRRAATYADTSGLYGLLRGQVQRFEADVRKLDDGERSATVASYVLCGFVDEAILNTPWGAQADWANRTLLAEFHDEIWAGEKTYAILERLRENPTQYRPLLELVYVCLALGFAGKYRRREQGQAELETIRRDLYTLLERHRAPPEPALSPNWVGAKGVDGRRRRSLPLWVALATSTGLLVSVYTAFALTLGAASDPVAARAARVGLELPVVQATGTSLVRAEAAGPKLVDLLRDRIDAGELEAGPDGQTLILRSLFSSGAVSIDDSAKPLLRRVADALAQLPGQVSVAGHTDNTPIRTLRFPSNWELSEARAYSVMQRLIADGLAPERLRAEAYADSVPSCTGCDQDSVAVRSANRRVEIHLSGGAFAP